VDRLARRDLRRILRRRRLLLARVPAAVLERALRDPSLSRAALHLAVARLHAAIEPVLGAENVHDIAVPQLERQAPLASIDRRLDAQRRSAREADTTPE
jgi:hypothetical protein